ncbi:general secretion pathway protein GspL, partial [Cupriavidus sp. UYMMa02A]
ADRAWLRAVLDAFAEHRHRRRHILPAQMCVPLAAPAEAGDSDGDGDRPAAQPATLVVEAAAASLAQAEGMVEPTLSPAAVPDSGQWQLTVRTGRHEGYGLLLGTDALAAWQALAPEGQWQGDASALATAPVPALQQASAADWRMWITGAQGCLQEPGLDLAQFEFAQGRADRWNLLAWRLPLALAAGIVLVQLLGMNVHWLMLRHEQRRLEAAQLQTLHAAFPQIQTVLDAPLQMRRQVEQLRLASGRSTPDDFLPLADRFGQAARQLPPDGLQALEYRSRALVATLKPGTDTAALRGAVRQAGLQMEEDKSADATRAAGPAGSRWVIKPGL